MLMTAESEATNENIFDDGESQALSYEDIKALKDAGATGRVRGSIHTGNHPEAAGGKQEL